MFFWPAPTLLFPAPLRSYFDFRGPASVHLGANFREGALETALSEIGTEALRNGGAEIDRNSVVESNGSGTQILGDKMLSQGGLREIFWKVLGHCASQRATQHVRCQFNSFPR